MNRLEDRLEILGVEILVIHKAAETAKRTSLERAREAGVKLAEAKRLCGHRRFLPWLKNIGLPERTAQDYMRIAGLGPEKYATVADLGMRAALEAIRQPRPDPAANRRQPGRDGPDFWPTSGSLIAALVQHIVPDLPPQAIWECAAGDGRLADALTAAGRSVFASDLYPQNDGQIEHDFLMDDPPAWARASIVVTNPPFNRSTEFMERMLWLLDTRVISGAVLLLRHDHLMASGRVEALNRAVREVHCNWRPIWLEDTEPFGNPRWSFHWLVWHRGPRQPPLYLHEWDLEPLLGRPVGIPL